MGWLQRPKNVRRWLVIWPACNFSGMWSCCFGSVLGPSSRIITWVSIRNEADSNPVPFTFCCQLSLANTGVMPFGSSVTLLLSLPWDHNFSQKASRSLRLPGPSCRTGDTAHTALLEWSCAHSGLLEFGSILISKSAHINSDLRTESAHGNWVPAYSHSPRILAQMPCH